VKVSNPPRAATIVRRLVQIPFESIFFATNLCTSGPPPFKARQTVYAHFVASWLGAALFKAAALTSTHTQKIRRGLTVVDKGPTDRWVMKNACVPQGDSGSDSPFQRHFHLDYLIE